MWPSWGSVIIYVEGRGRGRGRGRGKKKWDQGYFRLVGGRGGLNFLCRSLEGGLWFEVHFKSGALPKVSVKHRVINLWLSVAWILIIDRNIEEICGDSGRGGPGSGGGVLIKFWSFQHIFPSTPLLYINNDWWPVPYVTNLFLTIFLSCDFVTDKFFPFKHQSSSKKKNLSSDKLNIAILIWPTEEKVFSVGNIRLRMRTFPLMNSVHTQLQKKCQNSLSL